MAAIPMEPTPVWGIKLKDYDPKGFKLAEMDRVVPIKEKVCDPSDPKWYVRAVGIPTPDHVGLKVNARHLSGDYAHYNPSEPDRKDVRGDNYNRRVVQYAYQGFHSAPNKPYQGIGDPFYLEHKELLLHALGQWDGNQALDGANANENGDPSGNLLSPDFAKNSSKVTPVKFVLQRARKDLNNISNEEKGGRLRIRNVRLGHALKQQLRQETDDKQGAKLQQENKKREMLNNAWRPPRTESDEELSDAETEIDADLTNYIIPYNPPSQASGDGHSDFLTPKDALLPNRLNSSGKDDKSLLSVEGFKTAKSKPSRGTSTANWRQKVAAARPFTPLHTSITSEHFTHWPEKESLFRQLCSLYWILEAMNVEPHLVMSPISTSWRLDEIGGVKMPVSKQADAKKVDMEWSAWKRWKFSDNSQVSSKSAKRTSVWQQPTLKTKPTTLTADSELRSTPSSSHSTIYQQPPNPSGGAANATVPNKENVEDETTETTKPNGISRLQTRLSFASDIHVLNGHKNQEDKNGNNAGENDDANNTNQTSMRRKSSVKTKTKKTLQDSEEFMKQLDAINREEQDARLQALANPRERRNAQEMRADTNIRPKSAPWVVEYENKIAPSNKWKAMPTRLRQRFEEITEEKALMLHDAVEAKDRERIRIMKSKLLYLTTGVNKEQLESVEKKLTRLYKTGNRALAKTIEGKIKNLSEESSSYHRAVDWMRTLTMLDQKILEKTNSSTDQPWYMELKANIPDEMQHEWHINKILNLLGKYGQINSAKQSAYKFLDVLCKLRDWEVCSPDISSAVEFCRDKIVDMSVEDFETWFKNQFPMVTRPQTAPPGVKTERDKVKDSARSSMKSAPSIRTS